LRAVNKRIIVLVGYYGFQMCPKFSLKEDDNPLLGTGAFDVVEDDKNPFQSQQA